MSRPVIPTEPGFNRRRPIRPDEPIRAEHISQIAASDVYTFANMRSTWSDGENRTITGSATLYTLTFELSAPAILDHTVRVTIFGTDVTVTVDGNPVTCGATEEAQSIDIIGIAETFTIDVAIRSGAGGLGELKGIFIRELTATSDQLPPT